MNVREELDRRAAADPRLERYRVPPGGHDALARIPVGWYASEAIERLLVDGGWWPGELVDHDLGPDFVSSLFGVTAPPDPPVRWLPIGTVFERDGFETPLLREPRPTAPLLGFSNQALWASLVFPSEEAMLEAFLITYDELGIGAYGQVNPCFVEWVTGLPDHDVEPDDQAAADRAHRRIRDAAESWTTDHPCWDPTTMPILTAEDWPDAAVAAVLGLPIDEIRG